MIPRSGHGAWRKDPVGFSKTLLKLKPNEQMSDILSDMSRDPERLGLNNENPTDVAVLVSCLVLWKALCWGDSTSVLIAPTQTMGASWITLIERIVAKSHYSVKEALRFNTSGLSINVKECDHWAIAQAPAASLDTQGFRDLAGGPLTLVIPDIRLIPGCYLKDACDMLKPGDLLLVNNP